MHALYIKIYKYLGKIKRVLKWSRRTITHLMKFHTRAVQIFEFLRDFVTLKVAPQFVLKVAHLAFRWNRVVPSLAVSYPNYGSWERRTFVVIHVSLTLELPWQRNDAITFFTCLCISRYRDFFFCQKSLKVACTSLHFLDYDKVWTISVRAF